MGFNCLKASATKSQETFGTHFIDLRSVKD